jgi:hypothetical protein
MAEKASIEEIKKVWTQSADTDILKAVTEDIEGYSPEIRNVIIEEAAKRQLIEVDDAGKQIVTSKGRETEYEIKENRPKTFVAKIIKSVLVLFGMSVITGAAINFLKFDKTAAMTANGVVILGMLEEIWAKKPLSRFLFKKPDASGQKDIILNKRNM